MKTYDLRDAERILHLHPDTLQRRARAGQIRAAKPGKEWVFRECPIRWADVVKSYS